MKIEIQLSAVQESAVNAVANVLRVPPSEAVMVLAFMPVGSNYGETAEFREQAEAVLAPVARGELPELAEGQIAGCIPLNTHPIAPAAVSVSVPLTAEDIDAICHDLASELYNDMDLVHRKIAVDEDDFAAVLKAWREHSPHYVEVRAASEVVQKARGFRDRLTPRDEMEQWRACHEEAADRLERLLPYLEQVTA